MKLVCAVNLDDPRFKSGLIAYSDVEYLGCPVSYALHLAQQKVSGHPSFLFHRPRVYRFAPRYGASFHLGGSRALGVAIARLRLCCGGQT